MIAYIEGKVIYNDGSEYIVQADNGIGYQIRYSGTDPKNIRVELFLSQIVRENSQELFGFKNIGDKRVFESLLKVSGVGPKSAYSLIANLGADSVCEAILLENSKILQSAPGIGKKAATQIILDLKKKVQELMGSNKGLELKKSGVASPLAADENSGAGSIDPSKKELLQDSLMACSSLGFKEADVLPTIRKILIRESQIVSSEELMQKVLKELG